jgi:hypothetical protein
MLLNGHNNGDQGHLSQVQEDWWDATEDEEVLGLGIGEGDGRFKDLRGRRSARRF